MGAPLTIEQMIINHNIGVNISDAESLSGQTIDKFAMKGHEHSANDITSGTMNPTRLPQATSGSAGVVQLSNSTDSESQTMAVTPYALLAVKNMALGKAGTGHKHSPADITTSGTFGAIVIAQSNNAYTTRQVRNIYLNTKAPASDSGMDGDVWMVYE